MATRRRGPGCVRILGVDPGTRVLGWGIVDSEGSRRHLVGFGTVAPRGPALHERLGEMAAALRELAREHDPQEVALEEVFHAHSARAAIRLGEGRGAVMAAVAPLPVFAYPANEVKKAVTGRGGVAKLVVARMVALQLGLGSPPSPADASDALAIALCHASRRMSPSFRLQQENQH